MLHYSRRLLNVLQEYSLPLIIGVIAGLAASNIDAGFHHDLVEYPLFGGDTEVFGHLVTVHYLINGMFMVLFFGIAAKEITTSVLPGGPLNPVPKAINPLMGTLGGVFGPVGVYFLLTWIFYGGSASFSEVANGWGIPTATDIAVAWLVARLVFGNGHPAVNFLLLLAVADDALGLGIIAVFYSDPEHPAQPIWLLLTLAGMAAAYGMRRAGLPYWPAYILLGGGLSWVGLAKAGIEPALALVVIVPFLPASAQAIQGPSSAHESPAVSSHHPPATAAHGHSPLERFEHSLKLFVDLGLFFFAFANAGVAFSSISLVTVIVLLSLIGGKTIGIFVFSWAAHKAGFPLPEGMGFGHLKMAGLIAGIGLTVALFVAGKAFVSPHIQDPAKMGAVLSAGAGVLALGAGRVFRMKDDAK